MSRRLLFALTCAALLASLSCQSTDDASAPAKGGAGGVGGASTAGASGASGAAAGVAGASSAGAGGASTGARDWTAHPAIAQRDGVSELWITSDVHGDYETFTKLLAGGGVIATASATPDAATWSGGAGVVVVVGDLIDKGPDAPDVIRLAIALGAQARAAGGDVVVTMGNHEAEFLASPASASTTDPDGFAAEVADAGVSPSVVGAGGDDLGVFLRDLPFAARIDDWFFAHAGDTHGASLADLDQMLHAGVDANGFGDVTLSAADSLLEARVHPTGAQWWDATGDAAGLLTTWTTALGAKHLVMGHQPGGVSFADGTTRAQDEMLAKYQGLLFLVDTGMSVGVDATGGALLHVTSAGTSAVAWERVTPDGAHHAL